MSSEILPDDQIEQLVDDVLEFFQERDVPFFAAGHVMGIAMMSLLIARDPDADPSFAKAFLMAYFLNDVTDAAERECIFRAARDIAADFHGRRTVTTKTVGDA